MQSLNIKEWKLWELQITQTMTPSKHFEPKNVFKFKTPQNDFLWNVQKIGGAHIQWVNNHYAKFEYKGMKKLQITH